MNEAQTFLLIFFFILCWWAATIYVAYKIGHADGRLMQVQRDLRKQAGVSQLEGE